MHFRSIVIGLILSTFAVWFFVAKKSADVSPLPQPSEAKTDEAKTRVVVISPPQINMHIQIETPAPGHSPTRNVDKTDLDFEIKEGYAVAFGDTLLGKPSHPMPNGSQGTHHPEITRLWPQSTIPFYIRPELKNAQAVQTALDHIEKNSPLHFRPMESSNEDGLVFEVGQELCASYMGRVGGPQTILIAEHCTWNEVVHEVLHALGFPHEQSRPDRDKYVEVLTENIDPRFLLQFEKVPSTTLDVLEATGFDYRSIMLYSQNAFAKSAGLETIKSRDPRFAIEPSRDGLSSIDKDRLFRLFNSR